MQLFGQAVPRGLPSVIDRVGAVVEQPRFLPGFSGERNLELLARAAGLPRARVGESLERVGLAGRERDRYRTYSLGMKQRLAIAATLLKQPDLLILDEPTNGLDPGGIRDIRGMIRDLGLSGVTVLLSSHLLAEHRIWVRELAAEHADLESVFLRLTGNEHRSTTDREDGR